MDWSTCLNDSGVATLGCIPIIARNLVDAAFAFLGIVAILVILYASYKYITSRGDQNTVEEAKKTLTYGVIGFVIIILTFFFIKVITTTTGVEQLNPFRNPGSSSEETPPDGIGETGT